MPPTAAFRRSIALTGCRRGGRMAVEALPTFGRSGVTLLHAKPRDRLGTKREEPGGKVKEADPLPGQPLEEYGAGERTRTPGPRITNKRAHRTMY